ncbi:helix-turn-helix domain-containing protein [Paenibacillus cellulositrophicus]|uniref:helix-turn-helix domain-containing protein n=1 Tax=Paenibacillus cellulositrophicus TaxID=562959 RepID=UPI00203A4036|nr:helix-turn-helix transcriptional regulator [Paenibacillus cellulositrophicus]MCM3000003.1 helix-turn-helix domain-containing protein [Paenibacillus cellulositrophicus]
MGKVMKGNTIGKSSEEEVGTTDFGALVKFYRKLRDYSLKDLECASGGEVSSGYIHRLESGERSSPSIGKILALAKALRIPASILTRTLLQGLEEEERPFSLSEVLIKNNYFLGSGVGYLIRIIEHIDRAEWSPQTKMREMYQLSEMIDDFKQAMD